MFNTGKTEKSRAEDICARETREKPSRSRIDLDHDTRTRIEDSGKLVGFLTVILSLSLSLVNTSNTTVAAPRCATPRHVLLSYAIECN